MAATSDIYLRAQLEDRRKKLLAALAGPTTDTALAEILVEVDSALDRMDQGTYGICDECHDSIEADRLLSDPLIRFCLDHLSAPERRALERDLELAAAVQRALLPPKNLRTNGWEVHYAYEPAGAVSGDYCDVIQSEDGAGDLFFSLGDVSGKGVAASMLMTHLHAMLRSLNSVSMPLDQLISRASRVFCESTTAGQYATLVCGRASQSGTVEFSSAGHLPVFVVRQENVQRLDATGLPLGMFCSGEYPAEKVNLKSGDSLVLYTDGLTETLDSSGNEYGLERLARLLEGKHSLNPQALTAACLFNIKNFSSGLAQKDDRTLLILRRM